MHIIEIEGKLDDDLEELLFISGKLKSREQIMREILLRAIDPAIPLGPEFEFEVRPEEEDYISLEVPDSGAKVDLAIAWQVAKLDAQACALVLDRDDSTAATLRVYRNQLQWLSFWSSRHPHDKWRAIFERQLEQRKTGLKALKDKATLRFNLPMLEELQQVFSWRRNNE
jgi:hypothetical protein